MEAWDVIIIGEDVAGMRAAIAAADSGVSTLILTAGALGQGAGVPDSAGIAASVGEDDGIAHREDTIRNGSWLCDQDIVKQRCDSAVSIVAEMERWGLVLRRDENGLPQPQSLSGHANPRVVGCGDSTRRDLHRLLQEQCIKRGIPRRTDTQVIELVTESNSVRGLIALDLQQGELVGMQARAIIISGTSFTGAWTGIPGSGSAAALALRAGVSLKNMEFQAWNPLFLKGTDLLLPSALLACGASIRSSDGTTIDHTSTSLTDISQQTGTDAGAVLDARGMARDSILWFAGTVEQVASRSGLDINSEVIPIETRIECTLGGVPVDEEGRVILGEWGLWLTGMYATGDVACSGLNGSDLVSGNRLLDALAGGMQSGAHAGTWASEAALSDGESVRQALRRNRDAMAQRLDSGQSSGVGVGSISNSLTSTMSEFMGLNRSAAGLEQAAENIRELADSVLNVLLHDSSPVMNNELAQLIELEGLIELSSAAVASAISRCESRGGHQREDYPEPNDGTNLQHTLVDSAGNISALQVRQGKDEGWLIAPLSTQ